MLVFAVASGPVSVLLRGEWSKHMLAFIMPLEVKKYCVVVGLFVLGTIMRFGIVLTV